MEDCYRPRPTAKLQLADAQRLAEDISAKLMPAFNRLLICGSIRRQRPSVKDIDLVGIPEDRSRLGLLLHQLTGEKLKVTGQIVRFFIPSAVEGRCQPIPVDLYLTEPERLVIIALIRTGSAEHNRWLATRALAQGKRLNFARGVEVADGSLALAGARSTEHGALIDLRAGEAEIFAALGLPNIPPACRELGAPHIRESQPFGCAHPSTSARGDPERSRTGQGESSPGGSDS